MKRLSGMSWKRFCVRMGQLRKRSGVGLNSKLFYINKKTKAAAGRGLSRAELHNVMTQASTEFEQIKLETPDIHSELKREWRNEQRAHQADIRNIASTKEAVLQDRGGFDWDMSDGMFPLGSDLFDKFVEDQRKLHKLDETGRGGYRKVAEKQIPESSLIVPPLNETVEVIGRLRPTTK